MSNITPPPLSPANPDVYATVPDHSGQRRDPQRELFGNVPRDIGQILSADSTLPRGKDGWSAAARLALAVVVAGIAGTLMCLAITHVGPGTQITICIAGGALSLFVVFISWAIMRLVAETGYVATDGLYWAKIFGARSTPLEERKLRFADAAELHVSQTRNSVNSVYSNTEYAYNWNNSAGKNLFEIIGAFRKETGDPDSGHPYYFARAAELAWSNHALAAMDRQLQQDGFIQFRLNGTQSLRVGAGFMEFHFGGEPHRVTRDDIASVSLNDGQFHFKHKDARWYSRDGKYNFRYSSMPNAKLFLLALDKLMGYRWA